MDLNDMSVNDWIAFLKTWLVKNRTDFVPLRGDWKNCVCVRTDWVELHWNEPIDGKLYSRMHVVPVTQAGREIFQDFDVIEVNMCRVCFKVIPAAKQGCCSKCIDKCFAGTECEYCD